MFELARHWARRSGVSEREEDLESVSAKKILVVTIEVVDALVGVGVSVVRAEAIVVTTEDGVGGIIKQIESYVFLGIFTGIFDFFWSISQASPVPYLYFPFVFSRRLGIHNT